MSKAEPGKKILKPIIKDVGEKLRDFSKKKKLDLSESDTVTDQVGKPVIMGDKVIVPGKEEGFVDALLRHVQDQGYTGGINYGRIGSIFDGTENIEAGSVESYQAMLENLKTQNKELFNWAKRKKTLTMEEMVTLANEKGIEKIYAKLITRPRGTPINAEEVVGSILILKRMMSEFKYGTEQLKKLADPQTLEQQNARRVALKKLQVIAGQMSYFSANFSAGVSESARAVGVLAHVDKLFGLPIQKLIDQADALYKATDERMLDMHVIALSNLDVDQKVTMLSRAQDAVKLTSKVIQESYIMGLVSAGTTHTVNMASNIAMQVMRIGERGIAGGIGEVREQVAKLVGGEKARGQAMLDRAYMQEAFMGTIGLTHGLKDGLLMMGRSAITGEANDLATKLDFQSPAIGTTNNLLDITEKFGKILSGDLPGVTMFELMFDIMGIANRLPGRALVMEDEFFKGMIRQKTVYQEATRQGMILYKTLKGKVGKNGEPLYNDNELMLAMTDKIQSIILDPPDNILELAQDYAIKETFQGQVRAPFDRLSPIVNNFFGRMLLSAFYKTPSNIFSELGDRTVNPSPLIDAIKNGQGREFDEAMSKLIMGWGIVAYGTSMAKGMFGDDIVINGAGATNKRAQNIIMGGANVPRGTIGVKKFDKNWNWTGEYEYIPFTRLDPFSFLLMGSSDIHNYMEFRDPVLNEVNIPGTDTQVNAVLEAMWLAVSQHSTDMPFLQTLAEFQNMAFRYDESGEEWTNRMVTYLGQRFGDATQTSLGQLETFGTLTGGYNMRKYMEENYPEYAEMFPLVGTNSLVRSIERVVDPTSNNTRALTDEDLKNFGVLDIGDVNPWWKGVYMAINKHKAGHSLYSSELPTGMNFWGETVYQIDPKKVKEQGYTFLYNPWQIRTGGYEPLDLELLKISEMTNQMFKYHPKRLSKNFKEQPIHKDNIRVFEMTAEELNKYSWVVNNIDTNGLVKENLELGIMGDADHDDGDTLKNNLLEEIKMSDTYLEADFEDRYKMLQSILTGYRSKTQTWMLNNVPRLMTLSEMALQENEEID